MKCEGYLFPDTYEFFTDDSVYNYVNTFYKEFDAKTSDLWDTINEKGTTMNDVVILASFIQEEAGMPAEDAKFPPASTIVWNPMTRSGQSISWNPMPAAIS